MGQRAVPCRRSGPDADVAEGPSLAHFDIRDAATLCLKLRDERTQRGHRNSAAIDPLLNWAASRAPRATSLPIVINSVGLHRGYDSFRRIGRHDDEIDAKPAGGHRHVEDLRAAAHCNDAEACDWIAHKISGSA